MKVPMWMKSLAQSRKFWLAFITAVIATVMFLRGDIDANALVDAILLLVGLVIATIAIEDGAEKLGAGRSVTYLNAQVEESGDEGKAAS